MLSLWLTCCLLYHPYAFQGGIDGKIFGSSNFPDGCRVETSPIVTGDIENGSVVTTDSGSKYFLNSALAPSSPSTKEKVPVAPRGVPTIIGWKKQSDGK